MKLHPRRAIVNKAKSKLIDFIYNNKQIKELTHIEKIIILNEIVSSYTREHLEIELRLERHNNPDKPSGIK